MVKRQRDEGRGRNTRFVKVGTGQEHSSTLFYARVTTTYLLFFLPQLILKLPLLSSILLVLDWLYCGFDSPVGNLNLNMNTKLSVKSNILIWFHSNYPNQNYSIFNLNLNWFIYLFDFYLMLNLNVVLYILPSSVVDPWSVEAGNWSNRCSELSTSQL